MLDLTNTTLLFVETRAHKITARVIEDCLSKADFGEVVIYTDKPELIPFEVRRPSRYIPCIDFPNKKEAGQFYYGRAMEAVHTDFALMLEWDGGIFDPDNWRDDFFDYDYIGAPWPGERGGRGLMGVGNGGFTLMSKRLGRFVLANTHRWPVYTDVDVCKKYRMNYEDAGFKWPDADLASFFSWELGTRNPEHFGYHAVFNWPTVLSREELIVRARLMTESDYLISKISPLLRAAPWLQKEIDFEGLGQLNPFSSFHTSTRGRSVSQQQRAAMQLAHIQRAGNAAYHIRNRDLKA